MSTAVPPLTYEQVLAGFDELRKSMKETSRQIKENDELLTKQFAETSRKMEENDERLTKQIEETSRQMEKTNKKIEFLGGRIGELIETMVEAGVIDCFQELGYDFTQCSRHFEFRSKELGIAGEIDFLLENGGYVCAVEVKTNLTVWDVKEHLKRLEKYRKYLDARGVKEKILGAIGGGVIRENVKQFAMKNGLFVIVQTGDSVTVQPPEGKKVKEW